MNEKLIEPQFLMAEAVFRKRHPNPPSSKVAHMRIGSATNERSTIATVIGCVPTGDTAALFWTGNLSRDLALSAVLNSLTFDAVMRRRLGGLHLDYHVFEQMPLPKLSETMIRSLARGAADLTFVGACADSLREQFSREAGEELQIVVAAEARRQVRAGLDALVAYFYGLTTEDLQYLLRDCALPSQDLRSRSVVSTLDPKGFWRLDSELEAAERLPNVALQSIRRLYKMVEANGERDGVTAFWHTWLREVSTADVRT